MFSAKGKNELIEVKENLYIIKNSNGFSIEINQKNKELIIRNSNFEVLNQDDFKAYISIYDKFFNKYTTEKQKVENMSKISKLKSNAHTFQTMLETYAVDYQGEYPKNVEELEKEAKKSNFYWHNIINPFNEKNIKAIVDYKTYKKEKNKKIFFGYVLYQPEISSNQITSYKVYLIDEKGEFLKDTSNEVFYLSNN